MKTKLATLLIAPALLFTACGAKSLSIEEVTEFVKTHYTHTGAATIEGKVKASWDFSKTTNKKVQDNFLKKLTEESGIKSPELSGNDVECPESKKMLGKAMNYETWLGFIEEMPYDAKFTVSNDELSMEFPMYVPVPSGSGEKDVEIIHVNTTGTYNNEGVLRYRSQKIDAYDFGEGYHYEGFMTFTAYDIKVTEPTL